MSLTKPNALNLLIALVLLIGCATRPAKPPVPPAPYIAPPAPFVTDAANVAVTITPAQTYATPTAKVNFVGTVISSTGAAISTWTWNFGDGIYCTSPNYCALNITHYYPKVGTYSVTLTATDAKGVVGTALASVTVENDMLTTALSFWPSAGNNQPIYSTVILTYTANSTAGVLTNITTDCGNGTTNAQSIFNNPPNGPNITILGINSVTSAFPCVYTKAGTSTAKLTVTDSFGKTSTSTLAVVTP